MSNIAAADQGMLAVDLADAIARAREEYAPQLPDVDSNDVLAALPAFLAALQAQAEARDAADNGTGLPARFADAPRAKSHGGVLHTCNPGSYAPRGNHRDPENCARCWELANGAEPRADHAAGHRGRNAGPTREEVAAHRASCRACRTPGAVCTAFDW